MSRPTRTRDLEQRPPGHVYRRRVPISVLSGQIAQRTLGSSHFGLISSTTRNPWPGA